MRSLCSYLACFCAPALADQCAFISKRLAIKVISRLSLNDTIYYLCEPCGEKVVKKAMGDKKPAIFRKKKHQKWC